MSQAKLSRITGIRTATINEMYHGMAERFSVDHVDRICEALSCTVGELLEFVPNQQRRTGEELIVEEHGNHKNTD